MLLSQINSFKFGSAFAFLSSGTDEVVSSDLHKKFTNGVSSIYSKMIICHSSQSGQLLFRLYLYLCCFVLTETH